MYVAMRAQPARALDLPVYGTCSIAEPVRELVDLGLLPSDVMEDFW